VNRNVDVTKFLFIGDEAAEHDHRIYCERVQGIAANIWDPT